ncbi:MAG TPA: hypothetical protein VFV38_51200 [Ktedonobacteraceae bacterium]|nr:hypothetical protein [Ktedonobacteraceae bacterium]
MPQAAQAFPLPGILPEQTQILLDTHARTAILLKLETEKSTPLLRTFQLTPSAARIFQALLQAYPQYCPYQTLLSALYPGSQEAFAPVWEQRVRPIRRALMALAPVLQSFGLGVVSLRGHGYLLTPATPSSKKRQPAEAIS